MSETTTVAPPQGGGTVAIVLTPQPVPKTVGMRVSTAPKATRAHTVLWRYKAE